MLKQSASAEKVKAEAKVQSGSGPRSTSALTSTSTSLDLDLSLVHSLWTIEVLLCRNSFSAADQQHKHKLLYS
jgi:hypothetical protein